MKISKLFHWCYAFLMLLPIGAIGVKCGYVIFNKNANDSYRGEYSYEQSISIQSIKTLNNLTWNTFTINNVTNGYYESELYNDSFYGVIKRTYHNSGENNFILFNVNNFKFNNVEMPNVKSFYVNLGSTYYRLYYSQNYFDINTQYITTSGVQNSNYPYTLYNNGSINTDIDISFNIEDSRVYGINSNMYLSDFSNVITNIFLIDTTLSNVFYSSLQELDKVEFFSWAKNSFLAQPFMYIGNLFGIPNVHPIFTFLSYWLAISIIWLVFDLFMYMPLLVHKWIDKAKVE